MLPIVTPYDAARHRFLATVAKALGVDPTTQNISSIDRPIRIADVGARPIAEVRA
jgi:hypothetical protein